MYDGLLEDPQFGVPQQMDPSSLINDNQINHQIKIEHQITQINQDKSRDFYKINRGHWNDKQRLLYHLFLQIHHLNFTQKGMRRSQKIFKGMSNFIKTRAPDQCRSHHQKMQKKYKKFFQIIRGLRLTNFKTQSSAQVKIEIYNLLKFKKFQVGTILQQKQLNSQSQTNSSNILKREDQGDK